jgi:hypothetical protein
VDPSDNGSRATTSCLIRKAAFLRDWVDKLVGALFSFILGLLKWPAAIAIAGMTPACAVAFWELLEQAWEREIWASSFGMGFGVVSVAWVFLGRLRIVRFWRTMEHELTHVLFAWLTFIRVVELRSTDGTLETEDNSEGHVHLEGSNWLITISPYFFPTAAAVLLAATWALASQPTQLAHGLLGAASAFSIVSTWQETHRYQEDLKGVGFGFSWLFLPGANLLCYGMLLAYELGGPDRAVRYAIGVFEVTSFWVMSAFSV